MMKQHQIYRSIQTKALLLMFSCLGIMLLSISATAQEKPPKPILVTKTQDLRFGAIIQGVSGGQVIIDPQGSRTVTGSIIPANLNYSYYPAIFEVESRPGSIITILNGPDITLTGSNGGTLTMHIGTSIPKSPFINKSNPARTQVRIGGTLTVGNSSNNPSGDYTGTFSITFVQQ